MEKVIPVELVGIIIINGLHRLVKIAKGRDQEAMIAAKKIQEIWNIAVDYSNLNEVPRPYNQKIKIYLTDNTWDALLATLEESTSTQDD